MAQYALFQKELAKTPAYTFFCYIDAMYVGAKNISGIDQNTVLGHQVLVFSGMSVTGQSGE